MIIIQPNGTTKQTDLPTSSILQNTLDYILANDLMKLDSAICDHAGYEMYYINKPGASEPMELNTFAMYISNAAHRIRGPASLFRVEELSRPVSPRFNAGVRKLFDDRLLAFMSIPPETTRFFKNKHHEDHAAAAAR
jgi:hypothetical protein